MSRPRKTPEAAILAWFRTEALGPVELLFGLVQDVVRERRPKVTKVSKRKAPPPRPQAIA